MKNSENIDRMNSFLDWMENKIQSIHKITDDTFIKILEKI